MSRLSEAAVDGGKHAGPPAKRLAPKGRKAPGATGGMPVESQRTVTTGQAAFKMMYWADAPNRSIPTLDLR